MTESVKVSLKIQFDEILKEIRKYIKGLFFVSSFKRLDFQNKFISSVDPRPKAKSLFKITRKNQNFCSFWFDKRQEAIFAKPLNISSIFY